MDHAKKALMQKAVFAGLLVVLGLGIMNTLKFVLPAPGARVAAPAAPAPREVEAHQTVEQMRQKALLADATRVPIQYTAGNYRDPLVSLLPQPKAETPAASVQAQAPKPVPTAPNVRIEGMLWGGRRPQVLIDGKLYEIGDTVQDSEIVGITRDGVTVVNQGTTFVLRPPRAANASAQRPMMEHGR